jgi:hypothetical protein|tara:strand:- start:2147 stop:2398 length:252 start_codon:yes stop_codon:yes gene_type:complete
VNANREVNGTEATIPAIKVDLLAISDITTIITAVKRILNKVYIFLFQLNSKKLDLESTSYFLEFSFKKLRFSQVHTHPGCTET